MLHVIPATPTSPLKRTRSVSSDYSIQFVSSELWYRCSCTSLDPFLQYPIFTWFIITKSITSSSHFWCIRCTHDVFIWFRGTHLLYSFKSSAIASLDFLFIRPPLVVRLCMCVCAFFRTRFHRLWHRIEWSNYSRSSVCLSFIFYFISIYLLKTACTDPNGMEACKAKRRKKSGKRKELKYINQIESHQQWRTKRVERALNADADIKLRTIDFPSSPSRLSSNNMYLFVFQSFHYFYYYLIGCICRKNKISTENWISFFWGFRKCDDIHFTWPNKHNCFHWPQWKILRKWRKKMHGLNRWTTCIHSAVHHR